MLTRSAAMITSRLDHNYFLKPPQVSKVLTGFHRISWDFWTDDRNVAVNRMFSSVGWRETNLSTQISMPQYEWLFFLRWIVTFLLFALRVLLRAPPCVGAAECVDVIAHWGFVPTLREKETLHLVSARLEPGGNADRKWNKHVNNYHRKHCWPDPLHFMR